MALLATAVSVVQGASRCIILSVLVQGKVMSSNANPRPVVALAHLRPAGWWGGSEEEKDKRWEERVAIILA